MLNPTHARLQNRYAQAYWEEETSGSEALSKERLQAAFKDLIKR